MSSAERTFDCKIWEVPNAKATCSKEQAFQYHVLQNSKCVPTMAPDAPSESKSAKALIKI